MTATISIRDDSLFRTRYGTESGSTGAPVSSMTASDVVSPSSSVYDFAMSPPSRQPSVTFQDNMPRWATEAGLSLHSRRSPASSIVSTRTRTSIITSPPDDGTDGFDVQLGQGAIFRLGLDGRILNVSSIGNRQDFTDDVQNIKGSLAAILNGRRGPMYTGPENDDSQEHAGAENRRASEGSAGVLRSPSYKPGQDNISVQRQKQASAAMPPRSLSEDSTPQSKGPPLKRRGGFKLKVITRSPDGEPLTPASLTGISGCSARTPRSQHSPTTDGWQGGEPNSPAYIGRAATGQFPITGEDPNSYRSTTNTNGSEVETRAGEDDNDAERDVHQFEDSGISTSTENSYPKLELDRQDAYYDEAPMGVVQPPPMDSENDVAIHYTRLVRSMDANHRLEMDAKDEELGANETTIETLAKQVTLLKAELLMTKSQLKAMADPASIRNIIREDTAEAQSFSFPPLKLSHIRTLKTAVKKRAHKLRGSNDRGELQDTVPMDVAPSIDTDTKHQLAITGTGRHGGGSTSQEHSAAAAVRENLADTQLEKLRITTFWIDRCEKLEQQRNDAMLLARGDHSTVVANATREVDDRWRARWQKRETELSQQTVSTDEEKRKMERALAQRDEWASEWSRKNSELSAELGEKCDEIDHLKRTLELQRYVREPRKASVAKTTRTVSTHHV
ncbi:MAG: hypothetical protein M1833_004537 [Piccolia ochrophora]|nr:MAG: hypothetical protein M1833_004537 [Piccolia ochrophora]